MTVASPSAVALSRGQAEEFEQRWVAAWDTLDVDALAALCAPDVVFADPALPQPARGRDQARAFFEAVAAAYPDFRLEVLSPPIVVEGTAMALSRYRVTATMTGPWTPSGFAPTGARMTFVGIDEWTIGDGMLTHYATYYDTIGVARQLGIMPPAGGRAEQLLARAQHIRARLQRRRATKS
jgi:steroid delta-isomerase-like uncharacterized protein